MFKTIVIFICMSCSEYLKANPFQPLLHNWYYKVCGMCCLICGMVYIPVKDPLLLLGKSSPCSGCSHFLLLLYGWSFTIYIYIYTFYLQLYGIRHKVKEHLDSERGNLLLPPHGLLFFYYQQELFYICHPTDRIVHIMAFVTPVVEHWLEREIAKWIH